jgi:hypothetical protein
MTTSLKIYELHGERILECADDGPAIANDRDAVGLIADAIGHHASTIVIPVARLSPAFFELRTRIAGDIIQKFVNYRQRLVILGDVSKHVGESVSFHDFVREANSGNHLWFVADQVALAERLARR